MQGSTDGQCTGTCPDGFVLDCFLVLDVSPWVHVDSCYLPSPLLYSLVAAFLVVSLTLIVVGACEMRVTQHPAVQSFLLVFIMSILPLVLLLVAIVLDMSLGFWAWALCTLFILVHGVGFSRVINKGAFFVAENPAYAASGMHKDDAHLSHPVIGRAMFRMDNYVDLPSALKSMKWVLRLLGMVRNVSSCGTVVAAFWAAATLDPAERLVAWRIHCVLLGTFFLTGCASSIIFTSLFLQKIRSHLRHKPLRIQDDVALRSVQWTMTRMRVARALAVAIGLVLPAQLMVHAFVLPFYLPFVFELLLVIIAVRWIGLLLFSSQNSRKRWFKRTPPTPSLARNEPATVAMSSSPHDNNSVQTFKSDLTIHAIFLNFLNSIGEVPEQSEMAPVEQERW